MRARHRQPSPIRWILVACLAAILLAPAPAAAQPSYSRVVTFGDSLSDTGNAFALLGETATPPDYTLDPFLIPNAPYARGGQNFTNGATWIDLLARALQVPASAQPAFRGASPQASNYATGAARARQAGISINLPAQVGAFLQRTGGIAPGDALYVIAVGSNDVRDAVQAYLQGGPLAADAVLDAAVASITQQVSLLYASGARHFLIWSSPDVSLSPAAQILDGLVPGAAFLGSLLSLEFNAALAVELAPLGGFAGIRIVSLDMFTLLHAITATPGVFGLTNVSSACLTPNVPPFTCRTPDEYLFWDGMHPTRAAHRIIAQAALEALGH